MKTLDTIHHNAILRLLTGGIIAGILLTTYNCCIIYDSVLRQPLLKKVKIKSCGYYFDPVRFKIVYHISAIERCPRRGRCRYTPVIQDALMYFPR